MRTVLSLSFLAALAVTASAQIVITPGVTSTVTFDNLPAAAAAGNGTAVAFTSNGATNPGILATRSGTGTTIIPTDGSSSTGALYAAGTPGSTDRAFGSVGSGGAGAGNFAFGVAFQNGSALALVNPTVSFDFEQWRNGGNATAQVATFYYGVFATVPTLPVLAPPNTSDNGTGVTTAPGFTALPAGNLVSLVNSATAAALDGNVAANRTTINLTLTGVTLAGNESLVLYWNDINHPGNDHLLSVDNVSITANPVPEPASMAVLGLGLAALKRRRKNG